jgi:histidinol-phosphate/aromatic aminotransferase/cobyric acid decarboxylase-like protein/predicted GNAT family N-acyltransferase
MEIRTADAADREAIYRIRHDVYAAELGQHAVSAEGRLNDPLDESNVYLTAAQGAEVIGFVSITPPWAGRYSIDKYLDRRRWPELCDERGLFEVRLLTVQPEHRGSHAVMLLMYAALRWISSRGGRRVVAIGRAEVLALYERAGFVRLGHRFQSGAVTFELITATVAAGEAAALPYVPVLRQAISLWSLDTPMIPTHPGCYHGGASFEAIGTSFDVLDRRGSVVVADVLDAWFPPAPGVVDALTADPGWIARSSPPTDAGGLVTAIADARSVPASSIVVGSGSSDLVFRAFSRWLTPASRVLLLDPTYGEYAHAVERVIGAGVDRFELRAADGWAVAADRLAATLRSGRYDLAVLVNPNNPTGAYLHGEALGAAVAAAPPFTRIWIDEAYLEYAAPSGASLEALAASSPNVVVCKSLSKVYALSGLRAAYLVAAPAVAAELRRWTPPWPVSLPAQIAAVRALADPGYYELRWKETAELRGELAAGLAPTGTVTESVANFVLLALPPDGPTAPEVVARCRAEGVYLRDLSALSPVFEGRTVRAAVRGAAENSRIVHAVSNALR